MRYCGYINVIYGAVRLTLELLIFYFWAETITEMTERCVARSVRERGGEEKVINNNNLNVNVMNEALNYSVQPYKFPGLSCIMFAGPEI